MLQTSCRTIVVNSASSSKCLALLVSLLAAPAIVYPACRVLISSPLPSLSSLPQQWVFARVLRWRWVMQHCKLSFHVLASTCFNSYACDNVLLFCVWKERKIKRRKNAHTTLKCCFFKHVGGGLWVRGCIMVTYSWASAIRRWAGGIKTAAVTFVFHQPFYCFPLCLFWWCQRLYLLSSLADLASCRFRMTQFNLHRDCLLAGRFASIF